METIDQIASAPTYDLSADIDYKNAFLHVPLNNVTDDTNTNDINNNNLIKISLSQLFSITDLIDFGDADPGNPVQKSIVISNNSNVSLTISSFDPGEPFNVINDGCSPTPLLASATCTIDIEFAPITPDFFEITANIDIQTYNYTFPIILKTPAPDINLSRENIDFGFQPIYDPADGLPEQAVIYVNNDGDRDLTMSSINFSSNTMDEFEFIDNCMTENNAYLPGKVPPESSLENSPEPFCILVVNFLPKDLLVKSATITISSDDPNEPELTINITGNNTDNDGIDSAIEDAAPNNGDGDFDGGPDRLQNYVVSFPAANGIYTTLVTDEDMLFTNVKAVQLSTIEALPDGVSLDNE
ncbi:MAG: choice-of-anchor D domain-containing protein, partial [Thiotrichaceae bacterium]|nr:choice-of-anchor D domain-containing protein [Thiotrichaceae bacterium]